MEKVPSEVLDLIISELVDGWTVDDICRARLVCRSWNQHAIKHLFGTVTLYNRNKTIENDFQSWNHLMSLQVVKDNAHRVIIETCPPSLRKGHLRWDLWEEEGRWPEFTSAIDRIIDLDHLKAIEVRFSSYCRGFDESAAAYYRGNDDREMRSARAAALKTIYKAVKQREERSLQDGTEITPIRELNLDNLQNTHPPEELVNGLFKDVERLHIRILDEQNEGEDLGDFELAERFDFDHILEHEILVPVIDQLVELNLSSHYEWGLLPARFNGNDLKFPNLKTLRLGNFVIGYFDQLEWIFDQKSLTCLRLHECQIVTHFHFLESTVREWEIDTSDWEQFDGGPWFIDHPYTDSEFWTFDLKWNNVFYQIRKSLPKLTEFGVTWGYSYDWFSDMHCAPPSDVMTSRYTTFDMSAMPWPFTAEFGEGFRNDEDGQESSLEFHDRTYGEDARALNDLLQATFERRRQPRYV